MRGPSVKRCAGGLLAIGLLLLAGFGPQQKHSAPPKSEPAKLGFSYLSQAQVQDLWRRADNYALAEAFLKQCGAPSFVERRMILATRNCVEARALNRVATYFRKKVAELGGKQVFVCDTDQAKAIMKNLRAKIDRDIEEVRSMCRACLFC